MEGPGALAVPPRARVITIDPRGNGESDRPADPAAYGTAHAVAHTLAVMDELGVDSAVLVGLCRPRGRPCWWPPGPPIAWTAWSPSPRGCGSSTPPLPHRVQYPADEVPDTEEGWAKVTDWYMRKDFRGSMEFFFGECVPEPHSSKVIEDCVGWALQNTAEDLVGADAGHPGVDDRDQALTVLERVRCPVLVIHRE